MAEFENVLEYKQGRGNVVADALRIMDEHAIITTISLCLSRRNQGWHAI